MKSIERGQIADKERVGVEEGKVYVLKNEELRA